MAQPESSARSQGAESTRPMTAVGKIFDVQYGSSYELSNLTLEPAGIAFVSRSSQRNGISGRVKMTDRAPSPAGVLTVALGGSVLSTFLQSEPTYQGFHVAVLTARNPGMSDAEKIWYAEAIKAHRFRFSYGRQANRDLANLRVPQAPQWAIIRKLPDLAGLKTPAAGGGSAPTVDPAKWHPFPIGKIFGMQRGGGLTTYEANEVRGHVPFVGAAKTNNAVVAVTGARDASFPACLLTLVSNGQGGIGYCFYQPKPFIASQDVTVLTPIGFDLNDLTGVFVATVLSRLRPLFSFGRKMAGDRVRNVVIRLPSDDDGLTPSTAAMEEIMRTLPFSGMFSKAGASVSIDMAA